jgi:hypothetical protein
MEERNMGSAFYVDTKLLDHWSYGPLELVTCEVNPRTGPANVCRGFEADGAQWLSRTDRATLTGWAPLEHTEWRFALYLLNSDWGVLFDEAYRTHEALQEKTGRVRSVLEPLAELNTEGPLANSRDGNEELRAVNRLAHSLLAARMLPPESSFQLGRIVVSPKTVQLLTQEVIDRAIAQHARGDWGNMTLKWWQMQDQVARGEGKVIQSFFCTDDGTDFLVITNCDRSVTTVRVVEYEDSDY